MTHHFCVFLQIIAMSLFVFQLDVSCKAQNPKETTADPRRTPVVKAVERVAPSVVSISTQMVQRRRYSPWDELFQRSTPEGRDGGLRDQALGSGVIIDPKGYLVTNDHVVGRADKIFVTLSDGRKHSATLIGSDPENDIAILQINSNETFPIARLARSHDVRLGEPTIAMGNPFGLQGSVTTGVLSAVGRSVHLRNKKVFEDFIQTSAVINPGNSGGPLLNILGEVIGINVAIHSRGPGIGFAIPINRVREMIYRILDPRLTHKANLGLDVAHATEETPGALVAAVMDNSGAARSGLKSGDQIIQLNGRQVLNWIDFRTSVANLKSKDPIVVTVKRGTTTVTCEFQLDLLPEILNQQRLTALLGFQFSDLTPAQRARLGYRINGIRVTSVAPGSSAAKIGLQEGDLVFSLGGYAIKSAEAAWRLLETFDQEERAVISVRLIRDGENFRGALGIQRDQ